MAEDAAELIADHARHHAGAEAAARGWLDRWAARFTPAEHKPAVRGAAPLA